MFRQHARELPRRGRWILGFAVVSIVAAGCGGDDRAAQLETASRELREAQADVDEKRAKVASAEAELREARTALGAAQDRLAEARSLIGVSATDDVLFRSVQKDLLEDRKLEEFAIAAAVEKGVVTLSGRVSGAELRERAAEIAGATPGVTSVDNRIVVEEGAPEE
jgi:osmotically-inducible protein OsmY